jgi:anti-sigma-K factor RskA
MSSCCESEKKSCSKNFSVTVAAVIVCLIFAALVWKTRQYTTPPALGAERAAERAKALAELHAAETDALNNVAWIDQGKGIVRLPIADAVKLAEKQWQNPAQARATLKERVEKAFYVPPPPPPKPSAFE